MRARHNPASWRDLIVGFDVFDDRTVGEYLPETVPADMPGVMSRVIKAGGVPPFEYLGVGMTGVVLCDANGVGWKVGRRTDRVIRHMISDEYEWLKAAERVPGVREHVLRATHYDPETVTIRRECLPAREYKRPNQKKLFDLHQRIEKLMIPHGWTAPEFKPDSYVYVPHRGPVLVDASMPVRVGRMLVKYTLDLLAGRRERYERPHDLAFEIRREVDMGTIPASVGNRVLERLEHAKWKGIFGA